MLIAVLGVVTSFVVLVIVLPRYFMPRYFMPPRTAERSTPEENRDVPHIEPRTPGATGNPNHQWNR